MYVRNKEHEKRNIVLMLLQVQLGRQSLDVRVSNVHSIEEREKEKDG